MSLDRSQQVAGTAVVQKEDALSKPPQRGCAELVPAGTALRDVVHQGCAHVVDLQIRERLHCRAPQRGSDMRRLRGVDRRRVASCTTDGAKKRSAIGKRSRAAGRGRRRHRRGQHAHELCKCHRIAVYRRILANWSELAVAEKFVVSSGYPVPLRFKQLAGSPLPNWSSPGSGRSCPKISFEIPISTL